MTNVSARVDPANIGTWWGFWRAEQFGPVFDQVWIRVRIQVRHAVAWGVP